jgi:tetrahydromethanopterin S-methyltransferase subunit E
MRALCGSIITAGALIGLGLSALGVGTRYQNLAANDPASITYLKWIQLDTPLMLIIVVLLVTLFIGLATAFIGLAYHHERRHYERYRDGSGGQTDLRQATAPTHPGVSERRGG